ncbi:MAG TPA: hypothetical protein VEC36_06215 [Patescibacteria group bacterium]|nr:hypothetical protein [Patescibacteria group bacterium]
MENQTASLDIETLVNGALALAPIDKRLHETIRVALRAVLNDSPEVREDAQKFISDFIGDFVQKEVKNSHRLAQLILPGLAAVLSGALVAVALEAIHDPKKLLGNSKENGGRKAEGAKKKAGGKGKRKRKESPDEKI